MHPEILNTGQQALLPFLKQYSKKYYLVGGTALALHIGHRESLDFDLFTETIPSFTTIKKEISESGFKSHLILQLDDQVHFMINNIKLTFFQYPFAINAIIRYENFFRMPDLITLAAMKAFALGGRGKWKDYVDLYFILKHHYPAKEIVKKANELFAGVFNPGLFLKQICYFKDIRYDEPVQFMPGFEISNEEVKAFLTDVALTGF